MAKISDLYQSNYLKAADLGEEEWTLTIERQEMSEPMGDEKEVKPVVFFRGAKKGMVLNKTNAQKIAAAYGDATDDWIGKSVVLYSDMVTFQGSTVPALRVRIPKQSRTPGAAPVSKGPARADPMDDEIPF